MGGGRTLSEKINDNFYDLGGQWILPEHKALLQIVDKLGLTATYPVPTIDAGDKKLRKVIQVGKKGRLRVISSNSGPVVLPRRLGRHTGIRAWLASLELSYIIWKLDGLFEKITNLFDPYHCLEPNLARQLDCLTVEAYLKQQTRFKSVQDVLQIQIRLLTGADLNRISLLYLLSYAKWQNVSSFHEFLHGKQPETDNQEKSSLSLPPMSIKNGSQQICTQLVKQCIGEENVFVNQPVSHISILNQDSTMAVNSSAGSEKNIYITAKDGTTYQCSQVIVAIPPNMLKQVEFSPPLDLPKKYLISAMSMGTTIKFIITYSERFWLQDGFSGEFVSHGGPITWMIDGTDQNGVPTLVGLLGGHLAVTWSTLQDSDLKASILDQISVIFGSWALEPTGIILKVWQAQPFIEGGSVCFPGIVTMQEFHNIRKSHGPIHFAGTETSIKYMGTMAGAVHAGQRSAIEVLDILRPQSLTSKDYFLLKEINQKYQEEKAKPYPGWNVYRWTIVLPAIALITAWSALKLRASYGHLLVPR